MGSSERKTKAQGLTRPLFKKCCVLRHGKTAWAWFSRNCFLRIKQLFGTFIWSSYIKSTKLYKKKSPDKQGQLILLRDDARSLIANVVKVALLDFNCKVLLHSPNLTLTDFHLFRFLGITSVALPSTRIKNSKRDWKNFLATFWQNSIRHIVGRLEKIGNCYGGLLLQ